MTNVADKDPVARLYPNAGKVVSKIFAAMSISSLGLFVFSLLGRYFYFAELVGNFRCQILVPLILTAVLVIGIRHWWLVFAHLVAISWCMVGVIWIYFPMQQPEAGKKTLKVMSFNVLEGNSEYEKVISMIHRADPDVISILEYAGDWHQSLDRLSKRYPHQLRYPRWHGFGIAMYSKYPLLESELLQLTEDKADVPFLVASVNLGGQTVRLAALHVLSPTNRYRLKLRNRQFEEVAEILSKRDVPTVVMGDFNCTPWSPFLNDFLRQTQYRDSRKGFGYQATWHSGFWPLQIPIDHAFVSDTIHVHDRYVGPVAGSDHFPIVLEISTAN